MREIVYKVCAADDWAEAVGRGSYPGSPDDARDGYIHLSTRAQLAGTLARHFSAAGRGRDGLVLVALETAGLGTMLRWEPARDGSLFPHLYAPLDPALALSVLPLTVGADGRHILPEGLE